MRTERQIQAARENDRKSIQYDLSPRCAGEDKNTRSGKRNSARNSIHHGLHAQTLLLEGERPEFFNQLVNSLHEEFQPQTASEIATVESMAWARWRQKRLWSFEQAALNQEILNRQSAFPGAPPERNEACARAADAFSTLADNSKALHLMHRCETSCDRQFSRALRRLAELRGGDPRPKRDPDAEPDPRPHSDPGPQAGPDPANVEISERTQEVAENKEQTTAAEPDANPISVTPDPELASEYTLPDPGPEEPIDGGLHTSPANPESVLSSLEASPVTEDHVPAGHSPDYSRGIAPPPPTLASQHWQPRCEPASCQTSRAHPAPRYAHTLGSGTDCGSTAARRPNCRRTNQPPAPGRVNATAKQVLV